MAVSEYLARGEKVLAQIGDYYATDRRVIRYRRRLRQEELDDLSYPHISSLSLVSDPRRSLVGAGIFLLVVGVVCLVVNAFVEVGALGVVGYLLVALGIVAILLGSLLRVTYVQLRGTGISGLAEERFRLKRVGAAEARRFIALIRQQSYGQPYPEARGAGVAPAEPPAASAPVPRTGTVRETQTPAEGEA